MNENQLDGSLRELAARRVDAPDLRAAVRAEIARGGRAVQGGKSVFALPGARALLPVSIAAAVVIGVAVRSAGPAFLHENPQTEAAKALHLDMFDAVAYVRPESTLFQTEP